MQVIAGATDSDVAISEAHKLIVKTQPDRQRAADLWDALRGFRKQAEAQKEETCRPLKTAWEDAKKPFDEFAKECKVHEDTLQQKMSAWDREQDRLAREEQAKIQKKIDEDNAKRIIKAEARGIEPMLKVAPVVQAVPKSIETQSGTKQIRTSKKVYTPKNYATLMRDFPQLFELSLPKFNALAKTGMLDGRDDVEVTEEYQYAQRG